MGSWIVIDGPTLESTEDWIGDLGLWGHSFYRCCTCNRSEEGFQNKDLFLSLAQIVPTPSTHPPFYEPNLSVWSHPVPPNHNPTKPSTLPPPFPTVSSPPSPLHRPAPHPPPSPQSSHSPPHPHRPRPAEPRDRSCSPVAGKPHSQARKPSS